MTHHEMAYTMADMAMTRAKYGEGSRYQRTSDWRWIAAFEHGFTANGERRRVTVSSAGCVDGCKSRCHHVKTLERKIRDKRLELDANKAHGATKRTVTVGRWAPQWLEVIKPSVRPNAYNTDRAAMKVVVETIGGVKLADLTPADVRSVAAHIRRQGQSSSTALRYHGSLVRMLKAAALEGYLVPPNVLLSPKPTAAVNDREAVPIIQAIEALVRISALEPAQRSRWAIPFLQGHRQAESLGLTWPEVDLNAESLRISWQLQYLKYIDHNDPSKGFEMPDGYEVRHLEGAAHLVRPKTDAGWRTQPLVPWAAATLRTWREVAPENEHQLVWPGRVVRGKAWPRNPASDRAEWKRLQDDLDLKHSGGRPFHVHEIRHTTATLLLELGVPESVRVAIMGHSTVASTKKYEHVDLALARQALEKAADRLMLG